METHELQKINWEKLTHKLGAQFEKRAEENDKNGTFVFENYENLKQHKYFSAMIPAQLGGGGISFTQMCNLIRIIAQYCGSTALAFSMHQHLIAATIWKYNTKGIGKETLLKVVKQQLVLVSTGARDWLESNGEMVKTEGGYLFSANKSFASQSICGDVAVTSSPYINSNGEAKVLHFPVPLKNNDKISILDDWNVLGMRATGSQTIAFKDVFVPDNTIALERNQNEFHIVWDVVLTVAMPLIMSAYVGIAEKATQMTISIAKKYLSNQDHVPYLIGRLNNGLVSVQSQWKTMFNLTNNIDFTPNEKLTIQILSLKTNVTENAIKTVTDAMEIIGGQSYYKKNTIERLFRDVQAAQFHPLPKWNQYEFTGKRLLK